MGTLCAVAPWIVYWVLLGNAPGVVAALIALVVALLSLALGRVNRTIAYGFEIGSAATFSALTILIFVLSRPLIEPWTVTLSFAGILAVAVFCMVTGRPLVREFAPDGPPTDVSRSEPFGPMSSRVTSIWAGAAAAMTVSSAIPPVVLNDATNTAADTSGTTLVTVFSWIVPLVLFCSAALVSRTLRDRVIAAAADPGMVRRTSFVAFRELAIDELYYLAREKVEREVGAGMEAYDVNVGSAGTPLTGDESRESWPATYKVRERR